MKTRECENQLNCYQFLDLLYYHGGDHYVNICYNPLTWSIFPLYTRFEDPSIAKLDFYFLQYHLQVIFYGGPLYCYGHGSWSMCKAAPVLGLLDALFIILYYLQNITSECSLKTIFVLVLVHIEMGSTRCKLSALKHKASPIWCPKFQPQRKV